MQSKNIFLVFVIFLNGGFTSAQKNISVLFIGNSYTYSNNLPGMLQQIGYSMGDSIYVDSYTPGGYSLLAHSQDTNTINKIHQQPWDYVVLQDQSQRPSWEPGFVDTAVVPYALFLDSVIHANNTCTQAVFYMTWGRKYGDAGNCAAYPPVCTYAGMQQRLKQSYIQMSDTCQGIVAPVGEAFKLSMQLDTNINLYWTDYSHPSVEGSFLAACTFYGTILHKQITNQNYSAGLLVATAAYLQDVAWQTVKDSSQVWNLGVNEPFAYFNFQNMGNLQVQFSCPGNLNFNHLWYFGDTTFSNLAEPLHQYMYPYYFPVQHVVYDSCHYDSCSIIINATGQLEIDQINDGIFFSYYDKNTHSIIVQFRNHIAGGYEILLRDIQGQIVAVTKGDSHSALTILNAGSVLNGVYLLEIKIGGLADKQKIIVLN